MRAIRISTFCFLLKTKLITILITATKDKPNNTHCLELNDLILLIYSPISKSY